jgi:Calcineurin-like phosphoesterase
LINAKHPDDIRAQSMQAAMVLGQIVEAHMDAKHIELYRTLGYKGELRAVTASVAEETISPTPPDESVQEGPEGSELPPLGPEDLEKLEAQLRADPAVVLTWARHTYDAEVTEDQLAAAIAGARAALTSPETFIRMRAAAEEHEEALAVASGAEKIGAHMLPVGFTFPGMTDAIPIDPTLTKFETRDDAIGWVLFAGFDWLRSQFGGVRKAPFRWHNHPSYQARRFIYNIEEPTVEHPIDIALFSDFGTGLYHSLYIAQQFRERQFPYAVHLGDIYYAGRTSEFQESFERPLAPLLAGTQLFMLNSNHEMMSGSQPYFAYIDAKHSAHPQVQTQEGSYFCLKSSRFQLIGIDTDYHEPSRLREPELVEWLESVLREGKREQRTNILLSANEPYEYGKMALQPLLTEDLAGFANEQLIDLWFWGNTHYCALFDASLQTPFLGSCVGHAGYPYSRRQAGERSAAPVRFIETRARFPAWTQLRQDRGNNGYCVLRLKADGALELNYIDWMSQLRCDVALTGTNGRRRLAIASLQVHD